MTVDKGIFIKNIFYMLSYAFQELRADNFKDIEGEDFDNVNDLLAGILAKGISRQLKQGLHREYVLHRESLTTLKGKLDFNATIANMIRKREQLACVYDEFSDDCIHNQILKATIITLLKSRLGVKDERKRVLKRLLPYFSQVQTINCRFVKWSSLKYDRNTLAYRVLHNICYFYWQQLLLSTDEGDVKLKEFKTERLERLFEKFLLAYYQQHYPRLKASASQIGWNIDVERSDTMLLPIMQSDILLQIDNRELIIDAKYYNKILQNKLEKHTLRSGHLYQIQSYVFNHDKEHVGRVDGMLMYAKTQNDNLFEDGKITTRAGNIIYFRTLDLNQEFSKIKEQLDAVVALYH